MKSNIVDVCALVDLKADAADMQNAIEEVRGALQEKFEQFVNEQRYINGNLCPLNCVGKWVWGGAFTEPLSYNPFNDT